MGYSAKELKFIGQSELFTEKVRSSWVQSSSNHLEKLSKRTYPITPTLISDPGNLSFEEKKAISDSFNSSMAVSYFITQNKFENQSHPHVIHALADQLKGILPLKYPLEHPLENHQSTVEKYGIDGTLKVYDVAKDPTIAGYIEQGETSFQFDMHNDGLGSGGSVQTVILYCDSPPLFGGFTYFINLGSLALCLAERDSEAFKALFLPDAITMIRPRGKGALKVVSPILFVGKNGDPQISFRIPSGEYQVSIRNNCEALERAWLFLLEYCHPFSPGSFFVNFSKTGHGCIINNQLIIHGRTQFINGRDGSTTRVLARKWYMTTADDAIYKHVPGISIHPEFGSLFPELFGHEVLVGEWLYDPSSSRNVRRK